MKKFNPMGGLTDWQKVLDIVESLAVNQGVDLPLAIYYTVALTKQKGLTGLCNGLDLIKTLLTSQGTAQINPERRAELVNWLVTRIAGNVRNFTPGTQQLRVLYRCEEINQSIYDWFAAMQPNHIPKLDTLGFILFEHINEIECQQFTSAPLLKRKFTEFSRVQMMSVAIIMFFLGVLVFPTIEYLIEPEPNLLDQITQTATPLNSEQLFELGKFQYQQQLTDSESRLVDLYIAPISELSTRGVVSQLANSTALLNSIYAIFPKNEKVNSTQDLYQQWRSQHQKQFEVQFRRFAAMRTKAANMARLAEQEDWVALAEQIKSLENYAISLSPLYGRIDFIQQLLLAERYDEAQKQIRLLEVSANSLAVKADELKQDLSNR